MAYQIIKYKGKYGIYDSISDDITVWDCDPKQLREEYRKLVLEDASKEADLYLDRYFDEIEICEKPYGNRTLSFERVGELVEKAENKLALDNKETDRCSFGEILQSIEDGIVKASNINKSIGNYK